MWIKCQKKGVQIKIERSLFVQNISRLQKFSSPVNEI